MAKIIDITEKLNFEEKPRLKIKGKEIKVNNSAETMLKVMGAVSEEGEVAGAIKASELLFDKKEREKIEKLNLNFADFVTVVTAAMELIMGNDDDGGEE